VAVQVSVLSVPPLRPRTGSCSWSGELQQCEYYEWRLYLRL
jgi:hypothetical protein